MENNSYFKTHLKRAIRNEKEKLSWDWKIYEVNGAFYREYTAASPKKSRTWTMIMVEYMLAVSTRMEGSNK